MPSLASTLLLTVIAVALATGTSIDVSNSDASAAASTDGSAATGPDGNTDLVKAVHAIRHPDSTDGDGDHASTSRLRGLTAGPTRNADPSSTDADAAASAGSDDGENNPTEDLPKAIHHPRQPATGSDDGAARAPPSHVRRLVTSLPYHGGPIMDAPITVYYIWYGDWSGSTAPAILEDLATNLGASPYYASATTYTGANGAHVSASLSFYGSVSAGYTYGKTLTDYNILSIVTDELASGALPVNADGIYVVLTSADVTAASGFCRLYCGWHSYGNFNGTTVKFAFVGNSATQCPATCTAEAASPNGNRGADGMASVIAHELVETATDPLVRPGHHDCPCMW